MIKKKVGRPKLADAKTKKESLLVSLFVLVIIFIFMVIGYKVLTIDFDSRYIVNTNNTHENLDASNVDA